MSLWNSQRKPYSQIERILLRHQDINHNVIWCKGIANSADCTSRHAIPIDQLLAHMQKKQKSTKASLLLHLPIHSTISQECLQEAQSKDQQLERLRYLITLSQAPTNDPTLKSFHKIFIELSIGADGILYMGTQILLTTSLYDEAISLVHSGSHTGQDAIKHHIRAHFLSPSLHIIVRQHLETICHECQVHTRGPFETPLSSSPTPAHPCASLSFNLYEPLPDVSHIFVARCNLSHFSDAKLVKSTSTKDVLPAIAIIYINHLWQPKSAQSRQLTTL